MMVDWENPGYPIESHVIETEDHYLLTLTRITSQPKNFHQLEDDGHSKKCGKPVVLIVHGFLCSAEHWLINSPDKVLPYRLSSEGFDVWLANLRGTPLSRGHTQIPKQSKSRKYWDFSWHEMAVFDLPAMIDYILEKTSNKSLYYVGHSMGVAIAFTGLFLHDDLSSKIKVICALAPAVYGTHIRNKYFRLTMPFAMLLGSSRFLRTRELFGKTVSEYSKTFFPWKRNSPKVGTTLLKAFTVRFGAFGTEQIEEERMARISAQWPAPTSMKLFCHGVQCFKSGITRQYDYGRSGNLKHYGTVSPPEYDFGKINMPVAIFYSDDDELCPPKDVVHLSTKLSNQIGLYHISQPKFSHIDFMLGKDVNKLVYDKVIQILQEYTVTVEST